MGKLWRVYVRELREPALIGPGLRTDLPPRLRAALHVLFMTLHYAGFYVLFKPIAWLIVTAICRVRVRGVQHIEREDGVLLVSNHLSMFDPLATTLWLPRPGYCMVKAEYFSTPVLGGFVLALGGFPVRRGEADRTALRTAVAALKRGCLVGMYPEGTRSKTYMLQPGHPGAALIASTAGVPVVPCAVWGTENLMHRRKWGFLRRPSVEIVFGPAYDLKTEAATFAAAYNLPPNKRGRHDDLEFLSDMLLLKIADMLPPAYRGDFTADGVAGRYRTRDVATPQKMRRGQKAEERV